MTTKKEPVGLRHVLPIVAVLGGTAAALAAINNHQKGRDAWSCSNSSSGGATVEAPATAAPAPVASRETRPRDPVYRWAKSGGDAAENELIDLAMKATYKRCAAASPAIADGPELEGSLVYRPDDQPFERVNVSVKLRNPAAAGGHALWYMVTFDKLRRPMTIEATKDIAARMCGLYARNQPQPL